MIARLQALFANKTVANVMRALFLCAIIVYLAWRLNDIGWSSVMSALPTAPLYYVFYILSYLILPVTEMLIYAPIWRMSPWRLASPMLRKRALNDGVMGYSGEAFLAVWARAHVRHDGQTALSDIRDVNILSALVSGVLMLSLLGLIFFTGAAGDFFQEDSGVAVPIALAVLFTLAAAAILIWFRKHLFALSAPDAWRIVALHAIRATGATLLTAAMWWAALPAAPFMTWLIILTMYIALTRVPFLPSYDLLLLGLGLSLTGLIDAPQEAAAAMFLVAAALNQILNLALFVLLSANAGSKTTHAERR